jgi:hypothetical protein
VAFLVAPQAAAPEGAKYTATYGIAEAMP